MSNYQSQLNVTSAVGSNSDFRLDETHLTTLDFGQLNVFYKRFVLPRDSFNITYNLFSRNTPMNVPSYIDLGMGLVAAFCPLYQVSDSAEAFFQGFYTVNGRGSNHIPFIRAYDLDIMFCTKSNALVESSSVAASNFIITATDSSASATYFSGPVKFTYKGRLFYKILRGLGYQLGSGIVIMPSSEQSSASAGSYVYISQRTRLNAFPFLCFAKVYHDWFTSSFTYYNDPLGALLSKYKSYNWNASERSSGITAEDLFSILDSVRVMYKQDYFTNAWRYTNAPLPQQGLSFNVPTSSSVVGQAYTDNNDTTVTSSSPGNLSYLTSMQVRSLNALDNYIRRNNYAGTKPAIRALARFGIKTEDFKSNYADILDIKRIPLNIGDVTQTSETGTSPLGSFGGKGIISGDSSVSFKSSDYGYFFILGFLQLDVLYPQGYDRDVLTTELFDFYTPEFDGLGMQPISFRELVSDPSVNTSSYVSNGTKVFGFTERYNEYRTSRDRITGDFLLFSDMFPWHSGRQLNQFREAGATAQTPDFICYPNDKQSEFDRIFAMTDSETETNTPDHFYITSYFKVRASRPIKNSNQVANLGVGNINIQKNGTHVE